MLAVCLDNAAISRKLMTNVDDFFRSVRDKLRTMNFNPVEKYRHLIGQRFGKLVIQSILPEVNKEGKSMAHCKCDCGREKDLRITHLTHDLVKSCGQCGYMQKVTSERSALDLTGKVFGELKVIKRTDRENFSNVVWEVECKHGHKTYASATRLAHGLVTHCPICRRGKNYEANKLKKPPLQQRTPRERLMIIRLHMIGRCYNPKDRNYPQWGGCGIKVCEEWRKPRTGLDAFYNWSLANGWKPGLTLDRINVNGDYSPENCRWVTLVVQNNNRRNNRRIAVLGKEQTVAEWAREFEINPDRLYHFSDDKIKSCIGTLMDAKKKLGDGYYEFIKRRIF